MKESVVCPNCHERNDIHKFCVNCGHQLFDDDELALILDNTEPYCLNCGRPVGKGQEKCECGYEFRDINCPHCNSENAYANRFCTVCGKKLWTSEVCGIKYGQIRYPLFGDKFPKELRNTMMHSRYKRGHESPPNYDLKFPGDGFKIGDSLHQLQLNQSKIYNHLNEIISRWKIVSPTYCINCLTIIKPEEYLCKDCGDAINKYPRVFDKIELKDEKRVEYLKNKKYVRPVFDIEELKWNSKFTENYLDSLSPAIGESQFEYRERLKWEFAENQNLKYKIKYQLNSKTKKAERKIAYEKWDEERKIKKAEKEAKRKKLEEKIRKEQEARLEWEAEYIRQYGGGYCSFSCRYYYEEFFDSHGCFVVDFESGGYVEYYCQLGHPVHLGSFCKYYE